MHELYLSHELFLQLEKQKETDVQELPDIRVINLLHSVSILCLTLTPL